ncbi:MAG TPA: NYN domain-containing protein [Planctomycetota bacterium]|nr:NYN domain-containing protein [Planctomycetota bacterium]
MSDPKKVALFADVENVYLGLRSMYNRELSPELLVEKAKTRGDLERAMAFADWKELPEGLADKFKAAGYETVQVDRLVASREMNNKRREVVKDMVPVEMLAGLFATLTEKPEVGTVVIASGDRSLVPAVKVAKEKLSRDVFICALPGSAAKELEAVATAIDAIEVPPLAPVDEEGLSKLVPLMEELERRKRYLNFKYIRESVVRHGELKARTFDEAERLLSDAIACGLVLKQKVEDKYHPGQLFTAYGLNRDSALWKKYGNGLPAPVRTDEDEAREAQQAAEASAAAASSGEPRPEAAGEAAPAPVAAAPSGPAPALPTFGSAARSGGGGGGGGGEPRGDREGGEPREGGGDRERGEREGRRGRRGRRGRGGGGERREPAEAARGGEPRHDRDRDERRSQRSDRGRDEGRKRQPNRDPNRRFESVSRLFRDPNATPVLNDDEVDEERILRARGDMGTRRID